MEQCREAGFVFLGEESDGTVSVRISDSGNQVRLKTLFKRTENVRLELIRLDYHCLYSRNAFSFAVLQSWGSNPGPLGCTQCLISSTKAKFSNSLDASKWSKSIVLLKIMVYLIFKIVPFVIEFFNPFQLKRRL